MLICKFKMFVYMLDMEQESSTKSIPVQWIKVQGMCAFLKDSVGICFMNLLWAIFFVLLSYICLLTEFDELSVP